MPRLRSVSHRCWLLALALTALFASPASASVASLAQLSPTWQPIAKAPIDGRIGAWRRLDGRRDDCVGGRRPRGEHRGRRGQGRVRPLGWLVAFDQVLAARRAGRRRACCRVDRTARLVLGGKLARRARWRRRVRPPDGPLAQAVSWTARAARGLRVLVDRHRARHRRRQAFLGDRYVAACGSRRPPDLLARVRHVGDRAGRPLATQLTGGKCHGREVRSPGRARI